MMDLDSTGWPQLPTVGSKIEFRSGGLSGVCTIVRADHVCNAVGKPGARLWLQTERGDLVGVTLSQVRQHAVLIEDGLARLDLEIRTRLVQKHG
ncbi:MAG: hypothetical protein ACYC6N_05005 [Pirellulaceae bacterium]